MQKTSCLLILVIAIFMIACASGNEKSEPCRIENITLIDAEKDVAIKEFEPIPQNAVIRLSKLPTENLSLRINVYPENCASKIRSLAYNDNGGGAGYVDDKPPFAHPPDNFSWKSLFGKYDYKKTVFLTELRGERLFVAEIRDENDQIVKGSEYRLIYIIED